MELIFLLSSGLFLGWSLGANDAANIFGTAVATRMVKFRTAAVVASVFVVLGSVLAGSGTTATLSKLGAVDALGGAFVVALAAALTVFSMNRLNVVVSTTQSIVGAIVGWNFFCKSLTNWSTLSSIVISWIASPILAALAAALFYQLFSYTFGRMKISIFRLDSYTRVGLILVGAFGAFSLGANNIANVMGVFVPAVDLSPKDIGFVVLGGSQQLYLLGGLAIAVGIATYSRRLMIAVGSQLLQMSPQGALVVVLAHGLVLFVFSSPHLADLLRSFNLTPLPLVPLSSSQAVVGAIMGISCLRGRRGSLNLSYLGRICLSWLISPVVSGLLSFVLLFVFQNVFLMKVHTDKEYEVSSRSLDRLEAGGISHERLPSSGVFTSEADLAQAIADRGSLSRSEFKQVCDETQVINLTLDEMSSFIRRVSGWFTLEEIKALAALSGQSFHYKWEFREAIEAQQITLSVSKEHFIFQNFSHLPKNQ